MPPSDSFFFKCQNETNWNVVNVSKTWIPSQYTIHSVTAVLLQISYFFLFQFDILYLPVQNACLPIVEATFR